MTIFALSVKYQSVDVSLAVSCGMLPLLLRLCVSPSALCRAMSTVLYCSGQSELTGMLEVASLRLLQILAVTAGYVIVHLYCNHSKISVLFCLSVRFCL